MGTAMCSLAPVSLTRTDQVAMCRVSIREEQDLLEILDLELFMVKNLDLDLDLY